MKRTTAIFLTALILITAFTACSEKTQDSSSVGSENDIYVNNPSSSDDNGSEILNKTMIEQFVKQADIFSNQLLLSSLLFEEYDFSDIVIIENLSDIEIYRFLMSMYSYNDNAEYPYNNLSVQENTGFSVISNESAQYVVNEFFGIENWAFDINDEGFDFYDTQAQEYKSQRDLGGRNNNITLSNIASQYESSSSSIISQVTISTGPIGEDGNNPKPLAVLNITFNIVIENDKAHLQFHKVENIIN